MPEVSTVRSGDYEQLASFLAGFPGVQTRTPESWLARLRVWWDLNPAFSATVSRGWLLWDEGRIVGFFGSIPMKMRLGGKETRVYAGTTWRVLPEYRGMSMLLKRRQMDEHKEVLHFSTTPRREVVKMLKLLGYQPLDRGEGTDDHSLIILNFEALVRARFQNALPGALAAKLFSPVLRALQSFRARRLKQFASRDVRVLAKADAAFDDLWERTRTRYSNTNIRSAEMVNWYCFSAREMEKRLLGCFEGNTLFGYMVLSTNEDPRMRFLECVDVWIDPAGGNENVLGALVAKARECAQEGRFDRVVFPHFDGKTAALYEKLGLIRRPAWRRSEFIKGPREIMENITTRNSYFVRAQGDYGL